MISTTIFPSFRVAPASSSIVHRIRVLALPAILLALLGAPSGASASDDDETFTQTRTHLDEQTRQAIRRGLDYLTDTQNENGSWTDRVGRKVHYSYRGVVTEHIGVTALAGLAFLSNGSLPDQGPYAEPLRRALEYILEHTHATGFIQARDSRMYSHAFATLFLAQIYGCTSDPKVKKALKRAVRLIINSQNAEGGWRYLPGAVDSDMSITVCQVMALRSARNAGVEVPRESIDRAIGYVKKSFRPRVGAFTYQIEDDYRMGPSRYTFALTACGVTALYGAGEYDADEVHRGLEYLYYHLPQQDVNSAAHRFDYYYGQYYAIQAAFQKGGRFWSRWYRQIQKDLLGVQESAGNWRDLVGKNYATAMATIILQIPYQYLSITER